MAPADNWTITFTGVEEGLSYVEVDGVRIYDVRHLVSHNGYPMNEYDKIGYAIHHDAVVMTGTTIAEELARIQTIDRYHREVNGWPGIGYHRMIAPSGRVYILSGSGYQRAHVENDNHRWIGYCFMGSWTAKRPPEVAMNALKVALQWETNQRKITMLVAPHKRLTAGTECPGAWAMMSSWETIVLLPAPIVPSSNVEYERGYRDGTAAFRKRLTDWLAT